MKTAKNKQTNKQQKRNNTENEKNQSVFIFILEQQRRLLYISTSVGPNTFSASSVSQKMEAALRDPAPIVHAFCPQYTPRKDLERKLSWKQIARKKGRYHATAEQASTFIQINVASGPIKKGWLGLTKLALCGFMVSSTSHISRGEFLLPLCEVHAVFDFLLWNPAGNAAPVCLSGVSNKVRI